MAVTADAIAQDVMLPYIPIYGKYYCHDKDLSVDIVKQNSKDSMAIIFNKVRYPLLILEFRRRYVFADSIELVYFHDYVEIDNDVYYRKTGYDEDGKCYMKCRYRFSEGNVFCKKIWIEKRSRTISHYCNGEMNGKIVSRHLFKVVLRGQYEHGMKQGKRKYNTAQIKGIVCYYNNKETSESNYKRKNPRH